MSLLKTFSCWKKMLALFTGASLLSLGSATAVAALTNGQVVFIKNTVTNRYVLSTGDKVVGKTGDEGGWLKSPPIVGTDANYYNRAVWQIN